MMVQGLGPGLRTVATRRSVILSVEGLEWVLTFWKGGSGAALARVPSSAPPNSAAEDFSSPRRFIHVESCFGMGGLSETHYYSGAHCCDRMAAGASAQPFWGNRSLTVAAR